MCYFMLERQQTITVLKGRPEMVQKEQLTVLFSTLAA